MNKSHEIYVTCDDVVNELNHSSYKEEMLKQSDLFYIIYSWIQMENHPSMDLIRIHIKGFITSLYNKSRIPVRKLGILLFLFIKLRHYINLLI